MKQKLYLLIAAFLLFSLFSMSQSPTGKEVKPYFGQAGIKRKISEVQAVKIAAPGPLDTNNIRPLRFRLNRYPNFVKPEREGQIINRNVPGREGDEAEGNAEERKAVRTALQAVASGTTQPIHSNFLSTDFFDNPVLWPPDPSGDVSGTQIIVSTNLGIKVHNKPAVTDLPVTTPEGYSGDKASSTLFIKLDQFFSPVLRKKSFTSDPHVRYDRLTKRWIIVAIEVDTTFSNNLVLLAVSDGDRVTDSSSFTYYSFNSSLFPYNHDAPYAPFLDYPTLGVDQNSIVIGGNQFGYDSLTNVGYVIDKKKLIHGDLVVYPFQLGVYNRRARTASGMVTPQGVYNSDPEAKKSFFAGTSYYNDALYLTTIEYNKKNKPVLSSNHKYEVEPYNYPRDNSSPGGLAPIDQLDTRLFAAAIYKNKLTGVSSLWTAHAIGVDQAGKSERLFNGSDSDFVREGRTGSRWYKMGNMYSKPSIIQTGTIYDDKQPSGRRAVQYFNPSIAASGQGHSIVGGTTDAFNEYLNVFAAGRYLGDELGTSRAPVKATNTTAIYSPYVNYPGYGHYYIGRWGDYSQTVTDPADDQTIWTFQEYADVDDSYGIRVVQLKAPPPATPAAIGTLSNQTDTTIILEGTSVDHSGFFDPGKDEGGPGYNRLSVKSTGNIIVSNIQFRSPTKISFTLNTKNQPAGQYILIITNPDGQLAVTNFTIAPTVIGPVAADNSSQRALTNNIAKTYITGSSVFPNPTTKDVTLQITAAKEHQAKIVLIDVNGKQLFQKNYTFSKGSNQAVLPIEKFNRGTYIAVVFNSDNVLIATQKIVKE